MPVYVFLYETTIKTKKNALKLSYNENFSTENIDLMMEMTNKYPDKFPESLQKLGNNVIYYDPYFEKRTSKIFGDAEIFKIITS